MEFYVRLAGVNETGAIECLEILLSNERETMPLLFLCLRHTQGIVFTIVKVVCPKIR